MGAWQADMGKTTGWLALAVLLTAVGCQHDLDTPKSCQGNQDCPQGLQCSGRYCVAVDASIDAAPDRGPVDATPDRPADRGADRPADSGKPDVAAPDKAHGDLPIKPDKAGVDLSPDTKIAPPDKAADAPSKDKGVDTPQQDKALPDLAPIMDKKVPDAALPVDLGPAPDVGTVCHKPGKVCNAFGWCWENPLPHMG